MGIRSCSKRLPRVPKTQTAHSVVLRGGKSEAARKTGKSIDEAQPPWGQGPEMRQETEGGQVGQRVPAICLNSHPHNSGKHLRSVKSGGKHDLIHVSLFKEGTSGCLRGVNEERLERRQGSDTGGSRRRPGKQR